MCVACTLNDNDRYLHPCVQHASYIRRYLEVREERTHVCQLCIVWIVEPRRDRDGVVRMEDIRSRGVIQYYGISHGPA